MTDEETTSEDQSAVDDEQPKASRLEEEGEIAADYLEEFLDIADIDGDIDIDVVHGRATLSVVNEDEGDDDLETLVGEEGEVLDALQELTRLAVITKTGDRSRLMLDIGGYRAKKRDELTQMAQKKIAEVQETGRSVALDPMNAFERKVVHDAVAEAGLSSESEGIDPERRVVITPAS